MNATDEIDQLANQIYNYYRDLGSSRHNLTRNNVFKSFNLNNENSKAVFARAELIGVKFKVFDKKNLTTKKQVTEKLPNIEAEFNPWGNSTQVKKKIVKKSIFDSAIYQNMDDHPDDDGTF